MDNIGRDFAKGILIISGVTALAALLLGFVIGKLT